MSLRQILGEMRKVCRLFVLRRLCALLASALDVALWKGVHSTNSTDDYHHVLQEACCDGDTRAGADGNPARILSRGRQGHSGGPRHGGQAQRAGSEAGVEGLSMPGWRSRDDRCSAERGIRPQPGRADCARPADFPNPGPGPGGDPDSDREPGESGRSGRPDRSSVFAPRTGCAAFARLEPASRTRWARSSTLACHGRKAGDDVGRHVGQSLVAHCRGSTQRGRLSLGTARRRVPGAPNRPAGEPRLDSRARRRRRFVCPIDPRPGCSPASGRSEHASGLAGGRPLGRRSANDRRDSQQRGSRQAAIPRSFQRGPGARFGGHHAPPAGGNDGSRPTRGRRGR